MHTMASVSLPYVCDYGTVGVAYSLGNPRATAC